MTNGNARCVDALLEAGANPNAFILFDGSEGQAPISTLYFAATSNNVHATRALLARGANPNDGESVYHAAERNNTQCLQLLLEHGADFSAAHAVWGNTPLYFLAGYKPLSPSCASSELGIRWLLEHGANPNVPSHTDPKHRNPPRAENCRCIGLRRTGKARTSRDCWWNTARSSSRYRKHAKAASV